LGEIDRIDASVAVNVLAEVITIGRLPLVERCLIGIGAIDDAIIDDAIAANIAEQQDRRHLGGGNSVALVVVHVCQGKDEILGVAGSRKTNAKTIGSLACRLTPWTMPQEAATRTDVVRRTSV